MSKIEYGTGKHPTQNRAVVFGSNKWAHLEALRRASQPVRQETSRREDIAVENITRKLQYATNLTNLIIIFETELDAIIASSGFYEIANGGKVPIPGCRYFLDLNKLKQICVAAKHRIEEDFPRAATIQGTGDYWHKEFEHGLRWKQKEMQKYLNYSSQELLEKYNDNLRPELILPSLSELPDGVVAIFVKVAEIIRQSFADLAHQYPIFSSDQLPQEVS